MTPTQATTRLKITLLVLLLPATVLLLLTTQTSHNIWHLPLSKEIKRPTTNNLKRRWETCEWEIPSSLDSTSPKCHHQILRGKALDCMMRASASSNSVQKTKWTNYQALKENGWDSEAMDMFALSEGLEGAFQDLGLAPASETFKIVVQNHDRETKDPKDSEVVYPPTRANYMSDVDPPQGVMVASYNYGPVTRGEENGVEPERIIPLRQWSDVFGLEVLNLFATEDVAPGKLEHVFRYSIANEETVEMLRTIMEKDYLDVTDKWPGKSFTIDEPQALAALATPNGKGVAWLLGQHKEKFGVKYIDKVHIFNCTVTKWPSWCMYFHLATPS